MDQNSGILGSSRSTLHHCLEQEGVDLTYTYSEFIKLAQPNDGERLMIGHLHRLGYKVPRSRVRTSMGQHKFTPFETVTS